MCILQISNSLYGTLGLASCTRCCSEEAVKSAAAWMKSSLRYDNPDPLDAS